MYVSYLLIFFLITLNGFNALSKTDTKSLGIDLIVNFEFAYSTLDHSEIAPIKEIAKTCVDNLEVFLEVHGHTDWVGTKDINDELAWARAREVKRLLVKYGVSESRIKVRAFGEDKPIANNKSGMGRAENRRSEVRLFNLSNDLHADLTEQYRDNLSDIQPDGLTENNSEPTLDYVGKERDLLAGPEVEKIKSLTAERKSRYYIALGVNFNVLDAYQIKDVFTGEIDAEWVSKLNLKIEGSYQYQFKKKLWLGLGAHIQLPNYEDEQDDSFTWDGETPSALMGLRFDAHYKYTSRWELIGRLRFEEKIFITENNFIIDLEKSLLSSLQAGFEYKFWESQNYKSRLGFTLDYPVLSFNNSTERGLLGALVGLGLTEKTWFKKYGLDVFIYYGRLGLKNNVNSQYESIIGVDFSFRTLNWM